ncbi:MAG TPA: dihydropteroate synthase [Methylophaga aminisulfidivorans]|uniref:Dihydropteroate synthase n=2 Tax=root TaxID=1 RepID=A0A7C1ZQI7_9GAMM|nr:dihydropteroate synthase [Methylophaga aminisulfidivorans]
MTDTILFLTGKLAEPSLRQVLAEMEPLPFKYRIHQLGLSVAALMTDAMIGRRLKPEHYQNCAQIIVPGRCRGDLDALSAELGVQVTRGPDEVKDLPLHFGKARKPVDLSKYSVKIFGEIVDAPERSIDSIIERASYYRDSGADVIDIGCLPQEQFPHMEDAINALHSNGFIVSVDSLSLPDLERASKAGADYLLSLTEETIHLAESSDSIPILVPAEPGSLASLERAMEMMDKMGKPFIADAILDPIHFGLTESIVRYHQLRSKYPDIEIMMGVGNLTELTDADTSGINAMLFGIISELNINCVLATEVSPHARRAIKEADVARRMMYAAKENNSLPRDFSPDLLIAHERKPFPDTAAEIETLSKSIKDPNYRIKIAKEGIFVFNRDGLLKDTDPFEFYTQLDVKEDAGHAFYLGVELARAETAWQLGKRYTQDEELQWGCAVELDEEDLNQQKAEGTTMKSSERACGTAEKTTKKGRACGTADKSNS